MKTRVFASRCTKEIIRDPITVGFGLGFPIILILLFSIINKSIPPEAGATAIFEINALTPGMIVFGFSFISLFSAMLVSTFDNCPCPKCNQLCFFLDNGLNPNLEHNACDFTKHSNSHYVHWNWPTLWKHLQRQTSWWTLRRPTNKPLCLAFWGLDSIRFNRRRF